MSVSFNSGRLKSPFSRLIAIMGLGASIILPAHAADLIFGETYLDYSLPESVTEVCYSRNAYSCPDISVKYVDTSQDWINNSINARIDQLLPGSQPGYESGKASQSKPLSEADKKKKLDDFASSQIEDIPEGSSLNYQFEVGPSYLGHIGNVELFEINTYIYLGGAHGVGGSEYKMFDVALKKELGLKDILLPRQRTKFKALAYTEYKDWVKKSDNEIESYEEYWPFVLTENATLTLEGVALTYQPYEIAPYAYGMPTLTIPYSKLRGVIKPEYLPKSVNRSVK